ncbi:MAG: pseudouridine synthase [Methyloversatilis sp.]|uniref:pseudouridine synthase n=1 Tax=Methyloversatilis sp. TaxID=2569862 RepID=UPI0025FF0A20|nr:pseudouridine synthase [Methyloversatilis sp.]MCR6666481.1 pseudouridine synthase [Methyloversatilis sp.]
MPMTTRTKLGLPRKSDDNTPTDRDPARKPVRNSTAKSRTLSRNTTQVAPAAKSYAKPAAKDAAARKPRAARPDGDRPPRKEYGDRPPRPTGEKREWTPRPDREARPPRADSGERKPWEKRERPARSESGGNSGDRPPRKEFGERPPRPTGEKREWTPRPDRDARPPRAESGERKPWENRERPARSESGGNVGDRPPRKEFGDRPPRPAGEKREWTPRPDRDARPPRAEAGERKPWENRERPARSESGGSSSDRPPRKEFGDRPPRRSEGDSRPARAGADFKPRPPKAAPVRPAKAWDERETDKLGRVQAEKGEDGDDAKDGIRVSRWLADRGAASRREADDWIARGWVTVDGEVALLGQRVLPHQKVEVHKQARADQALRVTVLMHKPVGYVSGQAEDGHEPASVLFLPENQWAGDRSGLKFNRNHLRGLAPAGRLDIDSHGLLVLTQDGRVARQLIGEDSTIEKEYLVRVRATKPFGRGALSEDFPEESLKLLNHGLELDGEALKPAKVSWQNEEQLRFVLREGKKRQIRRMCELVGLEVVALKRVRIGRIPLADLPVGKWRYLRKDELF